MREIVRDSKSTYLANPQVKQLAELISQLLSSQQAGVTVVSALMRPGERVTQRNLYDRLRAAVNAGAAEALGLTPKRLLKLQSALALYRLLHPVQPELGEMVGDPAIAAGVFSRIAWELVEKCAVLSLDTKHRFLACREISSGTALETIVHPREVFAAVIQAQGTRCIVAHNHPSGSLEPSPEDIALTKTLLAAGKVMGIPVLDHLIVSGGQHTSMRETTDLWKDCS